MLKVSEVLSYVTETAPLRWQESYDNSGLLVGDPNALVDKVLVALDITEEVIDEAIDNSIRLIISHHPLIFKGLKNVLYDDVVGGMVMKAIKNDISIAAMHTNLDNSFYGVNRVLADQLGLKDLRILKPDILKAQESCGLELQVGSGMIGSLENEMTERDFLMLVKEKLNVAAMRHSEFLGKPIKNVALCGGSGSFLINDAKRCGADVYLTADVKYHDFFDAGDDILLVDAGHFETEQFTKQLIADIILKKNPKFAVQISNVKTNSVHYFVG